VPVVLTGKVIATTDGRPLDEITVAFGGQTAQTDLRGAFRLEWPGNMAPATGAVTLTGRQILPRTTRLSATSSRDVSLDAITLESFSLDYYRQLVRNGHESPNALRPVRRWTRAPMIYLKTVDERGEAIDTETLELVAAALGNDTGAFTGERFGIAGIQRGTGTQEGASGWITVKWLNPASEQFCGRAQVAVDGGWIELNHRNPGCGCRNSRMSSATVRHELGHAFGFFHTASSEDLMFNTIRTCEAIASKRERLHAAIAYSRPVGNVDPDDDPETAVSGRSLPTIVLP
jgi:hypothetical protein